MHFVLAAESFAVGPSLVEAAASVLYYVGMALLIGSAVLALLAPATKPLRTATPIAWTAAMVGALLVSFIRFDTFNLPLGEFLGTTLGTAAAIRTGALIAAYLPVLLLARGTSRAPHLLLLASALSAAGHAMGGHPNIASLPVLARTLQAAHIISIGAWIGALAMMLWVTRGEPSASKASLVRRFSTLAGPMILVVAATGVLRATETVGFSFGALIETPYGNMVMLKGQLLLLIAALGVHNRYREVPRAHSEMRGLRRYAGLEVIVATAIFGVTGFMSGTEPARDAYARTDRPTVVEQLDTGVSIERIETPDGITLTTARWPDGVEAQLYLDPQEPGRNELHVTVFGSDGQEVEVSRIVTFGGLSTADWERPQRFSIGHFIVRADLSAGEHVYAFNAHVGATRYRLVAELKVD